MLFAESACRGNLWTWPVCASWKLLTKDEKTKEVPHGVVTLRGVFHGTQSLITGLCRLILMMQGRLCSFEISGGPQGALESLQVCANTLCRHGH